jgi:predicted metalloenzyme YecM
MQRIEAQLPAYLDSLDEFIHDYDLPLEWFNQPDHIAYKCANSAEFDSVMRDMQTEAQQLSFVHLNNRRLGAAHLNLPLTVGDYGAVEWVEIMEPLPEKVGSDVIGLEHMEFYFPDFKAACAVLDEQGVSYEMQDNPNHEWISIIINDKNQELKINNDTLAHIVEDEIEQGVATLA